MGHRLLSIKFNLFRCMSKTRSRRVRSIITIVSVCACLNSLNLSNTKWTWAASSDSHSGKESVLKGLSGNPAVSKFQVLKASQRPLETMRLMSPEYGGGKS